MDGLALLKFSLTKSQTRTSGDGQYLLTQVTQCFMPRSANSRVRWLQDIHTDTPLLKREPQYWPPQGSIAQTAQLCTWASLQTFWIQTSAADLIPILTASPQPLAPSVHARISSGFSAPYQGPHTAIPTLTQRQAATLSWGLQPCWIHLCLEDIKGPLSAEHREKCFAPVCRTSSLLTSAMPSSCLLDSRCYS